MPTYYLNRYDELLMLVNSHHTHLYYLNHDFVESYEKCKIPVNEWFWVQIGHRKFYNLIKKHNMSPRQLKLFLPVQHTLFEMIDKQEKQEQ